MRRAVQPGCAQGSRAQRLRHYACLIFTVQVCTIVAEPLGRRRRWAREQHYGQCRVTRLACGP